MLMFFDINPENNAKYYIDEYVKKHLGSYGRLLYEVSPETQKAFKACPSCIRSSFLNQIDFVWIKKSYENYVWAYLFVKYLLEQYFLRFRREHNLSKFFHHFVIENSFPKDVSLNFSIDNLKEKGYLVEDKILSNEEIVEINRGWFKGLSLPDMYLTWTKNEKPFWL